jgi:WD40 repeat protein
MDKTVRVWNWKEGRQLSSGLKHTGPVFAVRRLPRSEHFVSTGQDNTVRLWKIEACHLVETYKGHKGVVRCVEASSSGFVVSGGADCCVRVWGIPSSVDIVAATTPSSSPPHPSDETASPQVPPAKSSTIIKE